MVRGKKHTAEQMVNLLRQVEVGVANGKSMAEACKEAEIVEQTYYRWRKEYSGLRMDQARRLKELERSTSRQRLGLPRLQCLPRHWQKDQANEANNLNSGVSSAGEAGITNWQQYERARHRWNQEVAREIHN